jgi:hypothetical protein
MDNAVKVFKEVSAFSEYLRSNPGLKLKVIAEAGRMSVVGAFNIRDELLAKVAGYRPKGA